MLGYILEGLIILLCIYAVFSNFGVRGWTKDNKLWWKQ